MALTKVQGVQIRGISASIPELVSSNINETQYFTSEEILKICKATGVTQRHTVGDSGLCASDLCFYAAEQLLQSLHWSSHSIDALIFVSQTPDYRLPATSCVLHGKLGLPKGCVSLDVNMGCSGYVYGLLLASQLMTSGIKRALLLVGDTISSLVSPQDRATASLFGDAGTATALEKDSSISEFCFDLGTDGTGYEHLIVPAGGFRQPHTAETAIRIERENGNFRSQEDLFMNGAEIFTFTLREVVGSITAALTAANWLPESVDAFVFHQANRFMLHHIAKRMKISMERVPLSIERFGNTSSASIPLTISHALADKLRNRTLNLVFSGFGVGLSWASVTVSCGPMVIPEIITVSSPSAK